MSIYGHYEKQYHGNKIEFPKKSFLIVGISNYTENCKNITYDTELTMKYEPDNLYDSSAISIIADKIVGYVPNISEIKELCKQNINEPLKIINIKKVNKNYGIRVIPKCFHIYDPHLEKQIFFSDS